MPAALITGISGFVGTYLWRHLTTQGWEVSGFDARTSLENKLIFIGQITDRAALLAALRKSKPDVVFHLAGLLKSDRPEHFYEIHVLGTVALFEAILESGLRPRVVVASSSAVYGVGLGRKQISESFQPQPATHYAISKLAQEMAAMRYSTSTGLSVLCVRTFNLLGPSLSQNMAPSAFARQIAHAELHGEPAKIFTGDLTAIRDYVDVRDAVNAYTLITERGCAGQIYNACSGQAVAIRECLQLLLEQAKVPMEVVLDPGRVQIDDIPIQVGSAMKLKKATGWKPEIPITQSLLDLLAYWREKINSGMEQ
jgi:GDP-4-dehydro-6-deoxy-D-mannose reductase